MGAVNRSWWDYGVSVIYPDGRFARVLVILVFRTSRDSPSILSINCFLSSFVVIQMSNSISAVAHCKECPYVHIEPFLCRNNSNAPCLRRYSTRTLIRSEAYFVAMCAVCRSNTWKLKSIGSAYQVSRPTSTPSTNKQIEPSNRTMVDTNASQSQVFYYTSK
jgi:hypothetical protein